MKRALKIALKGKKYTGCKRLDVRLSRQPDFGLILCWRCAHKPQVIFKACWQCCLFHGKSSDSLGSPKPSSGHSWLQWLNLLSSLVLRPCRTLTLFSVPVPSALGSGFLFQHLAKRPSIGFAELDLQQPSSAALQRFAFFRVHGLQAST